MKETFTVYPPIYPFAPYTAQPFLPYYGLPAMIPAWPVVRYGPYGRYTYGPY